MLIYKNLESLRKATEEEIDSIAKEQWCDKKMQEYCKNEYDYFMTKDGYYLEVRKPNKLSINKTMYYDDEYEAPEKNLKNFIENNAHQIGYDRFLKLSKSEVNIFMFYNNNNKEIYIAVRNYTEEKESAYLRNMEEDEVQDILKIYEEQKEKYFERLRKYFVRYNDQISTYGYWANR